MGCGQHRKRTSPVQAAQEHRALRADGIHDGQRISSKSLEGEVVGRIGKPVVAPIEPDHASKATESLEKARCLRKVPCGLEVGLSPSEDHDVVRAGTMDLVRDPEIAAPRIPGLRSIHETSLNRALWPEAVVTLRCASSVCWRWLASAANRGGDRAG